MEYHTPDQNYHQYRQQHRDYCLKLEREIRQIFFLILPCLLLGALLGLRLLLFRLLRFRLILRLLLRLLFFLVLDNNDVLFFRGRFLRSGSLTFFFLLFLYRLRLVLVFFSNR